MKLDQLKKGFWGYQKASVYEYITMMEEEFSEKLAEKLRNRRIRRNNTAHRLQPWKKN